MKAILQKDYITPDKKLILKGTEIEITREKFKQLYEDGYFKDPFFTAVKTITAEKRINKSINHKSKNH